jgi:hypothetical protein
MQSSEHLGEADSNLYIYTNYIEYNARTSGVITDPRVPPFSPIPTSPPLTSAPTINVMNYKCFSAVNIVEADRGH